MRPEEKIYNDCHLELSKIKNSYPQYKTLIENLLRTITKTKRDFTRKSSLNGQPETPPPLDYINHILKSVIMLLENPNNLINALVLNFIELQLTRDFPLNLKEPLFGREYTFWTKNLAFTALELLLLASSMVAGNNVKFIRIDTKFDGPEFIPESMSDPYYIAYFLSNAALLLVAFAHASFRANKLFSGQPDQLTKNKELLKKNIFDLRQSVLFFNNEKKLLPTGQAIRPDMKLTR